MIALLLFLLCALFVGLLVAFNAVFARLRKLEQKAEYLERSIAQRAVASPALTTEPSPWSAARPQGQTLKPATTGAPAERPATASSPGPLPPKVGTPSSLPPSPPSRTKEEWEALIGGKFLNRVGALALIIGVGFFLKYAFDNEWITEWMRVAIGALIGIVLLLAASRSARRGFQIFAQGLVGSGIAILYLSVYASFNFYALASQPLAFVLMALVTVIAFTQAFLYNGLAVSLLGWLGGFLTPFLLSTGESNMVGLLTYIALLDAGVLLVVLRKQEWMILEPLSLAATYTTFSLWYSVHYTPSDVVPASMFVLLFWILFLLTDLIPLLKKTERFMEPRRVLALIHAGVVFVLLFRMVHPESNDLMSLLTAAFGFIYLAIGFRLRSVWGRAQAASIQHTLTGVFFIVLATSMYFEDYTIVDLWSIEACLLVWFGLRAGMRHFWYAGLALFICSFFSLLAVRGSLGLPSDQHFTVMMSHRTIAYALLAGTMGSTVFFFRRYAAEHPGRIREIMHYAWMGVVLLFISVEVHDWYSQAVRMAGDTLVDSLRFQELMIISGVWASYGLLLTVAGMSSVTRALIYGGLWVFLIGTLIGGVRGISYVPIEGFSPVLNVRFAILIVLISGVLYAMWLVGRNTQKFDWLPEMRETLQIVGVLLLLVLLSGEIRDSFERAIADRGVHSDLSVANDVDRLENMKQLLLSGCWLCVSVGLMVIGLWKRARTLRLEAIALFGVAILKIFIYDLSFLQALYRIFSFIALGVILLVVSYLYQRYKDIVFSAAKDGEKPGIDPAESR